MSAVACHQLSLLVLETLLNNPPPAQLAVGHVWMRLNNPDVNPELREACNNSIEGLRQFLSRYPSLFYLQGDCVLSSLEESTLPGINHISSTPNTHYNQHAQYNGLSNYQRAAATTTNGKNDSVVSTTVSSTNQTTPGTTSISTTASHQDVTAEAEAVRYFQDLLYRREERWVHVRSLAGHLSQASSQVRQIVGPQSEFKSFLARHRHVFEIQGDLVGLTDNFYNVLMATNSLCINGSNGNMGGGNSGRRRSNNHSSISCYTNQVSRNGSGAIASNPAGNKICSQNRPKSLNNSFRSKRSSDFSTYSDSSDNTFLQRESQRRSLNAVSGTNSGGSSQRGSTSLGVNHQSGPASLSPTANNSVVNLTPAEYRAILYLRKLLENGKSSSNSMSISALILAIFQSPDNIKSTIGWTQVEVMEFLRKHSLFFEAADSEKIHCKSLKEGVTIMLAKPPQMEANCSTIYNGVGTIYNVSKLWGIIDLGHHEHVFFDKSILRHVDDLQKHFQVGEILYFNAILAPKGSRARWRATQVWKQNDRDLVELVSIHSSLATQSNARKNSNPGNSVCENGNGTYLDDDLLDDKEEPEEMGIVDLLKAAEASSTSCDSSSQSNEYDALLQMGRECGHRVLLAGASRPLPNTLLSTVTHNPALGAAVSYLLCNGTSEEPVGTPPLMVSRRKPNENDADEDCSQLSEPSTMRSIPSIAGDLNDDSIFSPSSEGVVSLQEGQQHQQTICNGTVEPSKHSSPGSSVLLCPITPEPSTIADISNICGTPIYFIPIPQAYGNKALQNASTQTISTGDIMPTNYYHESVAQPLVEQTV